MTFFMGGIRRKQWDHLEVCVRLPGWQGFRQAWRLECETGSCSGNSVTQRPDGHRGSALLDWGLSTRSFTSLLTRENNREKRYRDA